MKYFRKYVLSILLCFILTGCGQQAGFSESVSAVPESNFTESQTGVPETVMQQQTDANAEKAEIKSASDNVRPSKEEVLAMQEKTLDGMPETEISRLRENIKKAHTGSILTAKATFSWAGGIIRRSIRRMSS